MMDNPQMLIWFCLLVPLVGAALISVSGKRPNMRETITLVTASVLLIGVLSLLPQVMAGERPELHLLTLLPGISL